MATKRAALPLPAVARCDEGCLRMIPCPGEIYKAFIPGIHYVIIVSREKLNRGKYVLVVPVTSQDYAFRSTLPNCVPFRRGEFCFTDDCVAQAENTTLLEQGEDIDFAAGCQGELDGEAMTKIIHAIGNGGDLDAGETATINFSTNKVTLTLTGDGSPTTNFKRGTDIITSGSLTVNATNITVIGSTGVVTDNNGGVSQTGLAELKALTDPSIYDKATGKLTIKFDSSGAGNLVLAAAGTAGLEFDVGSGFSAAPGTNLDDGLSHTIDIRLATSREVIARITVVDVDGTGMAGTLDFDIGTGMFA
ncbi:MAG: hypothetical protein IID40_02600, partial [Planctomycetes bacterium]|nr:hypothetical protein [Planctomycetota bacterium]